MADVVWIQFRYRRTNSYSKILPAYGACVTCVRIFTWWFILISFHFFFYSLFFALLCFAPGVVRVPWCLNALSIACDFLCVFFCFYSFVRWSKSNALEMWISKTKPKNLWHAAGKKRSVCVCACVLFRTKSILSVDAVWRVYQQGTIFLHSNKRVVPIIIEYIQYKVIINNHNASLNSRACSVLFFARIDTYYSMVDGCAYIGISEVNGDNFLNNFYEWKIKSFRIKYKALDFEMYYIWSVPLHRNRITAHSVFVSVWNEERKIN